MLTVARAGSPAAVNACASVRFCTPPYAIPARSRPEMTRARAAASWMPSARRPIAASPSAPVKSSGAIPGAGPNRSAIPPTAQRLAAAAPVNAKSPQNASAGLARMCGANVRMAPPEAVITASAAIGPDSTRRKAAGPGPEPPAGARPPSPAVRAIGPASGMASAGTAASTKTSQNPARSASHGAAGTSTN